MYTQLLPIEVNLTNADEKVIEAPYMGASEYEWGAPQGVWAYLREACASDDARMMVIGDYKALYHGKDVNRVTELLTAMDEDKCHNKGADWKTSWEITGLYQVWLSMHPKCLIVRNEHSALYDWLLAYTGRRYLKTNTDLKINDRVAVTTLHKGVYVNMVGYVVGIPESDVEVTVKANRRRRRVPVWAAVPDPV